MGPLLKWFKFVAENIIPEGKRKKNVARREAYVA
jgi:hypothetical protein